MPIYDTHARSVVVWWPRAVAVVGGRERTASGLNARLRVYRYRVPNPSTLNPQPSTLNPKPSTLNPKPSTLNRKPSTLNPQP